MGRGGMKNYKVKITWFEAGFNPYLFTPTTLFPFPLRNIFTKGPTTAGVFVGLPGYRPGRTGRLNPRIK